MVPVHNIDEMALEAVYSINIYPNPTQSILHVNTDGVEIEGLRIVDALGKTLRYTKGNTNQVDVNELPAGMYVIEFSTNQGLLHKQFIKQ